MFSRRLVALPFFLAITALGASYGALLGAAPTSLTQQGLISWYKNSLKAEENTLKTELFTLVGIENQDEWLKIKRDWRPEYAQLCIGWGLNELTPETPFPEIISTPILELLGEQKIQKLLGISQVEKTEDNMLITATKKDGQKIKFCCDKKLCADAATSQFTVHVNPDVLLETHKTPAEMKATIAHELVHITHEDPLDLFCIDLVYRYRKNLVKTPRKKFRKTRGMWERFQEKRADILSGLIDIEYAQAHQNHFERNMPKKEKLKLTSTHPTDRQRHEYISKLVKDMEHAKSDPDYTLLACLALITLLLLFALLSAKIKSRNQR